MLYTQKTFTCPASKNTSQLRWDLAFLSPRKFVKKYGCGKTYQESKAYWTYLLDINGSTGN